MSDYEHDRFTTRFLGFHDYSVNYGVKMVALQHRSNTDTLWSVFRMGQHPRNVK